jgi:hypothetical protein
MTTTTVRLTGDLTSEAIEEGILAFTNAPEVTDAERAKYRESVHQAYREIIEDVTGGHWGQYANEVVVDADANLGEGWQDEIRERLGDVDWGQLYDKATAGEFGIGDKVSNLSRAGVVVEVLGEWTYRVRWADDTEEVLTGFFLFPAGD